MLAIHMLWVLLFDIFDQEMFWLRIKFVLAISFSD